MLGWYGSQILEEREIYSLIAFQYLSIRETVCGAAQ